jgi:trimeric autotransporter adhesin
MNTTSIAMKYIFIVLSLAFAMNAGAQVAINTDNSVPDNSAMLDIKSSDKGILIPRMTQTQRDGIANPATGLMIFQTDYSPGFYFNSGTSASPVWVIAGTGAFWGITGNNGISGNTNFIGTTSYVPLVFKVNNTLSGMIDPALINTSLGYFSLNNNTEGSNNTALGGNALCQNTTSCENTAVGADALFSQSYDPGFQWSAYNVAIGNKALYSNQPTSYANGISNTGVGSWALYSNTTGSYNTAMGFEPMLYFSEGEYNTAIGYKSMIGGIFNCTGYQNTSCGANALSTLTTGYNNCAIGYVAALYTGSGYDNTATGVASLYYNQIGNNNTADGREALRDNTTSNNTAVGYHASQTTSSGFQNTSIGANSLVNNTTGSYNTAVGYNTGPNAVNLANTTCIGIDATATATDMVRIGNVFVNSIGGQVGWTTLSDGRFKENVTENVPGLAFITQLRPVTYQINREAVNEFTGVNDRKLKQAGENTGTAPEYKTEPLSATTTGFIAQEVEQAAKNTGFDFSGVDAPKNEKDMYGLRYDEFVVPLVKAVQELAKQNAELLKRIEELEKKQ